MIKNDRQLGKPFGLFQNTKANIEALTGLTGGETAYATDTGEDGVYDAVAVAWVWGRSGGGGLTTGNIADDGVFSFTPQATSGFLIASHAGAGAALLEYIIAFYNTNVPQMAAWSLGSKTAASTGVLTGTTGADTYVTVSAHTDGKLYFENRRGVGRIWRIQILGTL